MCAQNPYEEYKWLVEYWSQENSSPKVPLDNKDTYKVAPGERFIPRCGPNLLYAVKLCIKSCMYTNTSHKLRRTRTCILSDSQCWQHSQQSSDLQIYCNLATMELYAEFLWGTTMLYVSWLCQNRNHFSVHSTGIFTWFSWIYFDYCYKGTF